MGLTEIFTVGMAFTFTTAKPISNLIYKLPTLFECTKQTIDNKIRVKIMVNFLV